jgi:hypothetical protein
LALAGASAFAAGAGLGAATAGAAAGAGFGALSSWVEHADQININATIATSKIGNDFFISSSL